MNETSKSVIRRASDYRYSGKWIVGLGIDIGSGQDSLAKHLYAYPFVTACHSWDIVNGDAQKMENVENNFFDFVHSSHCLEHLNDPVEGLFNWIRICKSGGHLVLTFPDEDLYEQGIWPSVFNNDHKHTLTIYKKSSWSPVSLNVVDLIKNFSDQVQILKLELIDSMYDYDLRKNKLVDQSYNGNSECAIEIVLRKIKNT